MVRTEETCRVARSFKLCPLDHAEFEEANCTVSFQPHVFPHGKARWPEGMYGLASEAFRSSNVFCLLQKQNAYNINGLVLPIWNALAFSFRFPTAAFLSDGSPISLKWFLGPKVSTHSGKNHSDQPPMVTRNKWWLVRDFHHNPRNIQV